MFSHVYAVGNFVLFSGLVLLKLLQSKIPSWTGVHASVGIGISLPIELVAGVSPDTFRWLLVVIFITFGSENCCDTPVVC